MKRSKEGLPKTSRSGEPQVSNPNPRSYDPRKEAPGKARKERKEIEREFGDQGRTRESGSNAGGSQSGDDSDQGASQWRRDPKEAERNSWQDKG
jgi:hypothetical protein